jgi:hypothetical protein
VGDDESGPEDAEDDLDLECVSPPFLVIKKKSKIINEANFS